MRLYLRLLRFFIANSIQRDLAYRGDFVMLVIDETLHFSIGLATLWTLFDHTASLGGWSFNETLAVYGVYTVVRQFAEGVLSPNLGELPGYIQRGQLDHMLLRPVDAQFLVCFRYFRVTSLPSLLVGFGILIYALDQLGSLSAGNLLLFLVMLLAGLTICFGIWMLVHTLAFWLQRMTTMTVMLYSMTSLGRFPVSAFPRWIKLILSTVFPLALVTTVPAEAALGRLSWESAALAWFMACALLLACRHFWRFALSRYTSASS